MTTADHHPAHTDTAPTPSRAPHAPDLRHEFAGRRALIVGGTSGMGKDVARLVLERGGAVALIGRRPEKLAAAQAELAALAGADRVATAPADLARGEAVDALLARIDAELADVDLLVNAAGVFRPLAFLEHTPADYDRYLDLNRATFFVTQRVARHMAARGRGAVVTIGSMWARQAVQATPSSAYSMAKAGLHAMTQHLAMELAPHGVRVNAVSPAVVRTPIYEGFIPKAQVAAALDGFNNFHPLGSGRPPRGSGRGDRVPALGPRGVGDGRGLGRGRRRDGRP
jgi:NAD(P)-dependent dehydrogenase (short-subunit alcohol dehydrogenase family)